jgi:regulator of protease activity HflC (stomatin/prohibitin superfamily)
MAHPPAEVRRAFEQEVRSERDNTVRAIQEAAAQLAQIQTRLANGGLPPTSDLRYLVTQAVEAYRHGAAWGALRQVEPMLPAEQAGGAR